MTPAENDNLPVCPHCGAKNTLSEEIWMNVLRGNHSTRCHHCGKTIPQNQILGIASNKTAENRNSGITFFIILTLLSGLIFFLNRSFEVIDMKKDLGKVVYVIMIILLVSSALAAGKKWQGFKYLMIWAGIFMLLMTGYTFRYELLGANQKIMAELIPATGFQKAPDSVSFPISSDGHFHIRADVNGTPVMFLVDTGATDIVLSPDDAEKVGIDTDNLNFDRFYETANGTVRGGSIRITDFRIGEIHLKQIDASVNGAKMSGSLLGMSFFKRLRSYEVKNDVLTLYYHN